MTIRTSTPQDTFTHIFGSGCLSYDWWQKADTTPYRDWDSIPDDWSVEVWAYDGENTHATHVTHKRVMEMAKHVLDNQGKMETTPRGTEYPAWSDALEQQCVNLLYNPDDADLDAPCADELLQLIVIGSVIYS
jgi:hypothetical protein